MILVARSVVPDLFGRFVVVYTALLFVNRLQFLLVTQPHNILAPRRNAHDYVAFTSATAMIQLVIAGTACIVALVAASIALAARSGVAGLLLAAAPAIVAWQGQEFVRRVLYSEMRLQTAFLNDVLSYGGQVCLLIYLWSRGAVSGESALYVLAGTSLLGSFLGICQLRRSLGFSFRIKVWKENWRFAKWLVAGSVTFWASSQAYVFIVAGMLGTAAAGGLRAMQVLLGPLNFLSAAEDSLLPVIFSRVLASQGKKGLDALVRRSYLLTIPIVAGYCLFLIALSKPLVHLLYGEKYQAFAQILSIFAGYGFFLSTATVVNAALRAARLTQRIFAAQIYGSAATICAVLVLVRPAGVMGVAIGLLLGALTLNGGCWFAYLSPSEERLASAQLSTERSISSLSNR